VDAIYGAVNRIVNIPGVVLEQYSLSAVTGGMDALGEATVSIRWENKLYSGRAAATDVVLASCRAYVNAINRMLMPMRKA